MSESIETSIYKPDLRNLLRGGDVARILNISRSKAYALIQSGEMTSVRIGGSVRVRPSDLEAFITARLSSPNHIDHQKDK